MWLYVTLFWTLLAAIYASQALLTVPRPTPAQLRAGLTWQCVYYVAWAPATLLIWRVSRGWDLDRLGWKRFLGRHAVLGLVLSTAHSVAVVMTATTLLPPLTEPMPWMTFMYVRTRMHLQLLVYAAVVATGQAIGFYNHYRERQLVAARLEAQLTTARLDALRARLQPHFLFNSLHSIATLARTGDNAGVVRLLSGLSDLLRHLLDTTATHHTVGEELALVEQYLDIQRVRFGDRLEVSVTTTLEAREARVPLLLVQPLVENSLRHGFASRISAGHIAVCARREGPSLVLDVVDDGVGLPRGWTLSHAHERPSEGSAERGAGTGLASLASRLSAEYGDRQSLSVGPRPAGGVQVTVRLPYEHQ